MTTILLEETDLEIAEGLETESNGGGVEIEVAIITRDVMTLVTETVDVEMSQPSRRNGNAMTADLGHQAETLAICQER